MISPIISSNDAAFSMSFAREQGERRGGPVAVEDLAAQFRDSIRGEGVESGSPPWEACPKIAEAANHLTY